MPILIPHPQALVNSTGATDPQYQIGVGLPFNNGNGVFNATLTTEQQLRANLINYVLTDSGERVFNEFGLGIGKFLFEKTDSYDKDPDDDFIIPGVNEMVDFVTEGINTNFPEIDVREVKFTKGSRISEIVLSITYAFFSQTSTIDIAINTNG